MSKSPLTVRQAQIVCLIAQGFEDKQIANMLEISLPTVKAHIRNILERLPASNRAEAVAKSILLWSQIPKGRV